MTALPLKQEISAPTQEFAVVEYNEFAAQMQELREHNKSVTFNYEDPKGNKEARSHVYKLRQTKSAIDKVRKKAGEDARQLLKDINDQGNALIGEVEGMIDLHQKHIDEVEEREKVRVADIKDRILVIKQFGETAEIFKGSVINLKDKLRALQEKPVDTSYQEFMAEATEAWNISVNLLSNALIEAEKREEELAELERLHKEAAEREQKEREERIALEAEERARKEAEAKAIAEKEAADKRERDLKEAADRAERDKVEAEEREERLRKQALEDIERQKEQAERDMVAAAEKAEREKQDAIEAERRRVDKEAADKAAADAKREADIKHQKSIHSEIITALSLIGVSEELAKTIITAIRKGEVPHVKIVY